MQGCCPDLLVILCQVDIPVVNFSHAALRRVAAKPYLYKLRNKHFVKNEGIEALEEACRQAGYVEGPAEAPADPGDMAMLIARLFDEMHV